jgi:hypothetical protein
MAFQPALQAGSPAATSWAIQSGGLPSGLTLNTSTGKISGTADAESEGSVFRANLVALNADGTSAALPLVIGIRVAPAPADGGLHAVWDLDTGAVGWVGFTQADELGRRIVHARSGDQLPLTVQFVRAGETVPLPVATLALTVDEYEPEDGYLLHSDATVEASGSGETARTSVWLDLSGAALAAVLGEYEDDAGTAAGLLAELKMTWPAEFGAGRTATRRSLPFWLMLHRKQS